jgi:hypothetical protein
MVAFGKHNTATEAGPGFRGVLAMTTSVEIFPVSGLFAAVAA